MKKLSILILSLDSRQEYLMRLLAILEKQITSEVELVIEIDNGEATIGQKRNKAVGRSTGEYIAFIDDDDTVSDDYIQKILEAIKTNPDCCSLIGEITTDGQRPELFEHSIAYDRWLDHCEGEIKYKRSPNHLNVIRRKIAIKYSFIGVNHGEDRDWSDRIRHELKLEAPIEGVIYYYKYRTNK